MYLKNLLLTLSASVLFLGCSYKVPTQERIFKDSSNFTIINNAKLNNRIETKVGLAFLTPKVIVDKVYKYKHNNADFIYSDVSFFKRLVMNNNGERFPDIKHYKCSVQRLSFSNIKPNEVSNQLRFNDEVLEYINYHNQNYPMLCKEISFDLYYSNSPY